jgi:mono/diheme cytochrome c family protein
VTEIPEHLLQRSRERREALGLGGGGEGGPPAAPPAEGAAPAAPAPAADSAPAPVAAAEVAVPEVPTGPDPVVVAANAQRRNAVPLWVMPVLVALPFWGFLYVGAFGNRHKAVVQDPLVIGAQVYRSAGCSGCHGANGEGAVGPALEKGDAAVTFPNVADQIEWVRTGSLSKPKGTPYGNPNRAGGQRKVTAGVMPAFSGTLTDSQIAAVVQYEREKL